VTPVRYSPTAEGRLAEIYVYTRETWGEAQADRYLRGLADAVTGIARGDIVSRRLPAEFGAEGWYARHERHVIYWKQLPDGAIGVVTILHERMHQMDRFREDAGD